jgi:creatinine amidohydrolase/Fe(II)-dependent formamide hydrolase-like protein
MRYTRTFFALLICGVAGLPAAAQIFNLGEMNTEQIRKLDRNTTVVLIPGGILEEHGPYLPSYTDGYVNAYIAEKLAAAIVARPHWTVLMFPQIPLGNSGANEIGEKYVFPGSYTIRQSTLRAVYMDLADQLGAQGFKWIFIVHDHGDPAHGRALDQAGDYFRDSYGGAMVHLIGMKALMECCDTAAKFLSAAELKEEGFTVHAGAEETSQILFLRPELVPATVKNAPSWSGQNFVDLYTMAAKPDWPGYFGAPRLASVAIGKAEIAELSRRVNEMALRILEGFDWKTVPRFADDMDPRDALGEKAILAHEHAVAEKQLQWMKAKKIPQ